VEFFGPEAANFTESELLRKRVHLEFEVGDQYDRYGRMLAYLVLEDGALFNAELIKEGYARVIAPSDFRHYSDLKRYEQEAREAMIGIWTKR
jgi:micrococcal nuclease